ncbi:MAG: orotidine-5'-phosphate decarboxylase [Rubricoccaceae bacterium]
MASSFSSRLAAAVAATGSPLCVGLDPDIDRIPAATSVSPARAAESFCIAITDSTADVAAAYKPNLAFFEALGPDGWHALAAVCEHIRSTGRLLILDGKRGDIGNTGRRYATALYDQLGGDAATVAPYMGHDSIAPFLEHEGRCAYVLVATSNPGGADLQQLEVDGLPLYRHVARHAASTAHELAGEVGFVAGATRPSLLAELREAHPEAPFLVPGVGAQGGSVADVLAANAGGLILVNSSRSILYASSGPDFADAAARAAEDLARQLET